MAKSYNYDPGKIAEYGMDRMRFELGDVMVEGGPDTTALTDEEIQAAIGAYPKAWKRSKLMLLESLCRRYAHEVDTKTGPLSLSFQGRAQMWKEDYRSLKKEVASGSCQIPKMGMGANEKPPYFYSGMQQNERDGRL